MQPVNVLTGNDSYYKSDRNILSDKPGGTAELMLIRYSPSSRLGTGLFFYSIGGKILCVELSQQPIQK